MPSHRQCTEFKHFAHSIQLTFESYFEIQHTTDLHRSFSLSLLGLLYDLLTMSSIMDQSLDNFASKRSFKFSKSIKTQPECRRSASFSKSFSLSHSHFSSSSAQAKLLSMLSFSIVLESKIW